MRRFGKIFLMFTRLQMHAKYLVYLTRHKVYVYIECRALGVSCIRGLQHDLSKYTPREWFPYVEILYNKKNGKLQYRDEKDTRPISFDCKTQDEFDMAFLFHQNANAHHWQYWCFIDSQGKISPKQMPTNIYKEMVADWVGAGRAQGKGLDVHDWYESNKHSIILHPKTRLCVERILQQHYAPSNNSSKG